MMPQNNFFVATKTDHVENNECDVLVYDWSKHPSKPVNSDPATPSLRLKGHSQEGYKKNVGSYN